MAAHKGWNTRQNYGRFRKREVTLNRSLIIEIVKLHRAYSARPRRTKRTG